MGMFRTAVLTIDRSTVLPLMYEYDQGAQSFRSVGFVRVGSRMVPEISHSAADTTAGRDDFLVTVLLSLLIPERAAQKIVRKAQHEPT
ncbi:hypothetical protein ACIA58_19735 [Kribbella sp. NPDC051586]|uniref:hypothetical protein n=1 Tax=Kribbella sp. NPDC051586 TaxID=3364118 RepID=UPI0037AEA058